MNQNTGKLIILAGVALLAIGMMIYFFHDKLHWLGRLPGDVRVERENFRFFFPVTTMILLSVLLNLVIWIVKKLINP